MHWSDIEELVNGLEESYAEEEIPDYSLGYLKEMVLTLSDFEDQEVEVENDHLKKILECWIDLRSEK
jgi:FeS assembly protein IscX